MFFDIAKVGGHFVVVVVVTMVVSVVMTFYWLIQIFFSFLPGSGKMVGKSGSQSRFLRIGQGGFGGRGGGRCLGSKVFARSLKRELDQFEKVCGGKWRGGGKIEKRNEEEERQKLLFSLFFTIFSLKNIVKKKHFTHPSGEVQSVF